MSRDRDRPCNGCTRRYSGCHGHCREEAAWLEKTAPVREKIMQAKKEDSCLIDYSKKWRERHLRKIGVW